MKATDAIAQVDKEKWESTDAAERLKLLMEIQQNLIQHADEFAESEARVRNVLIEEEEPMYTNNLAKFTSVCPLGVLVRDAITLYESLSSKSAKMLEAKVTQVEGSDDLWDAHVFPLAFKEKFLYPTVSGYVRIKSETEPKPLNPLDKPVGTLGILGMGNTAASPEIIQGLFFNNNVAVFKPHPLNIATEKVLAKILQPLVDHRALAFCDAEDGQALTEDKRLSKIYFVGGSKVANIIAKSTKTPFVSECGGNNPVIVVPGEWTNAELKHQALVIATVGKANGGAACGRTQTIVTCKNWPQREAFLDYLQEAIVNDTFAVGTYYPGSQDVFQKFQKEYPNGKILEPEGGKHPTGKVMLVMGDKEDGYSSKNEAFCQVQVEVPLDTPTDVNQFLPKAVEFCNNKLAGTLCATILIDPRTKKGNEDVVSKAVTDLKYGSIAVNGNAIVIWLFSQYSWGGNEEEKKAIESGNGSCGNLFGFPNVEKSIVYDAFVSPGHPMFVNKTVFDGVISRNATMTLTPTWFNHIMFLVYAIYGSFKGKDF